MRKVITTTLLLILITIHILDIQISPHLLLNSSRSGESHLDVYNLRNSVIDTINFSPNT